MLTLVRVPRLPAWPRWAIALMALWLGLAGLVRLAAPDVVLCTFKRATGIPCPGCGLTRGVTAIAHGDIARGLACNPLLLAGLLLFLAVAALRLITGRAVGFRRPRAALVPALLLLGANWAYVIHADRERPAAAAHPAPSAAEEGGVRGPPEPPR